MRGKRLVAFCVFIAIVLFFSFRDLKPHEIEGTYFHHLFEDRYKLILSHGKFTQILIRRNDTIVNHGEYTLSDVVVVYSWKERDEVIIDTLKGGCMGCELKYRNGKLLFYTDPDASPVDVFIKQ